MPNSDSPNNISVALLQGKSFRTNDNDSPRAIIERRRHALRKDKRVLYFIDTFYGAHGEYRLLATCSELRQTE